ncbi:MAG: hypothetical protein U9Q68_03815 [Euryarchaeota archaeon]|nr:hypothetical protein [Euryarchaeota archaeon]
MAYPIDPMKCKYWPEVFAEAGEIATEESGAQIAYYTNYHDRIVQLMTLSTVPMSATTGSVRVNTDAGDNKIDSVVEARPYMNTLEDVKVTGITSMALYGYFPAGGATGDLLYRYGLKVTKPTIFEKILYQIDLTDKEKALDTKFGISKMIAAGTMGGKTETQFSKIFEVAKNVAVTANTELTVDRAVHPPPGQKVVLLGVSIENYGTASTMFLSVRRDHEQVMKLDAHAFVDDVGGSLAVVQPFSNEMNYTMPCYVVALDQLEVFIESTADVADVKVRFRYGIAPLTTIDKIRWELPLTETDHAIATELDLYDSVRAGVL